MTERQARDEGAAQTELIVEAVRRARMAKGWSAAQLADEMAKVGVPWNESVVANLESHRRKSLRVHELLALAFVLDVEDPLDLLVPGTQQPFPVTPSILLTANAVRAWFQGETGPLRQWLSHARPGEPEELDELLKDLPRQVREQILMLARSGVRAPKVGTDGQD